MCFRLDFGFLELVAVEVVTSIADLLDIGVSVLFLGRSESVIWSGVRGLQDIHDTKADACPKRSIPCFGESGYRRRAGDSQHLLPHLDILRLEDQNPILLVPDPMLWLARFWKMDLRSEPVGVK